MKYRTRAKIAIAGVGLVCATALFGSAYRIIKSNKLMLVDEHHPIQYTVQCKPIEELEPVTVHMDTNIVEVEPQIEESNPEIEIEYYKSPINLTEDDRWFIECVVAGEAAGEPYEGKLAVAQCYFDAMIKDELTAREVRDVYQYSGWNEHLDIQNRNAYMDVVDAVSDVFDRGHFVTEKPILFFYAPALCDSPWHESQNYAMMIGGHKFFYATEDENAEWTNILLTNVNEYGIIEQ